MTSAAVVTGPVTSLVSMAWRASETGPPCLALPLAILAIPVGWVKAACDGVDKGLESAKSGTYTAAGTRRLRLVFDPWWGFPKGPAAGEDVYPPASADSPPAQAPAEGT